MSGLHAHLTLAFGLLGNIVSFGVFLAPLPTFYQIYKRKSTEGFQSIPYVVALFSAMLWMYYAMLKTDVILLITINSFGCVVETIYIGVFLFYAPKQTRLQSVKLIVLMNVVGFGLIVALTHFLTNGANRVHVIGWICLVFALSVFVAPLGVVRQVIKTKSVEYMPFWLSFFLTLSAVMWFFYGLLLKDINIAIPNVLGFTFGILQMVLFMMYKNEKKVVDQKKIPEISTQVIAMEEQKIPELKEQFIDVVKLNAIVSEMIPVVAKLNENAQNDYKIEVIPNVPNKTIEVAA